MERGYLNVNVLIQGVKNPIAFAIQLAKDAAMIVFVQVVKTLMEK